MLPAATDQPGVFVTGTASGPMDIVDSIVLAGAAAAQAAAYLESSRNGKAAHHIVVPEVAHA
jgi:heterodisulfide reductase subunit A-like polyferredoxin